MRRMMLWATLCAVLIALVCVSANAYPAYATATGKPCGYCHINPAGGGPLTTAGQYYFDNGTLPPDVPTAPTSLAASAVSQSGINLKWTDTATGETGYKVERSTSATGTFTLVTTLAAGATTYSDTGLTASTTYYYRVYAYNATGNSAYSNIASATTQAAPIPPPAAPTGLSASATSTSQINLTWTDVATNETGYNVERSSSTTGTFTVVATLAAGATTYSNTGLAASTTYYYRVSAVNASGASGYSNVASATTQAAPIPVPAAPTGLSAAATSTSQIDLKWTDAATNETGYKVEKSTSSTGTFTLIATLAAGATTYSDTGLAASTTCYYRVCAFNTSGASGYSNVASATTQSPPPPPVPVPAAPTGLSASATSQTQIKLSWTDVATNETGYSVERSGSASGTFTVIATLPAGTTTYSNTGLTASTTYYYRVAAVNASGASGYSNVASATTQTPPPTPIPVPTAPTGLSAAANSATQIDLKWTDASNNEAGFKVERSATATGTFAVIASLGAGATTYSDTGLTAATAYFYRVCAYNATGNSTYSNTASATTQATTPTPTPTSKPSAPKDLSAKATGPNQVELKWTDTSSNETSFKVERSRRPYGGFESIAVVPAGTTSYSDSGLDSSRRYFYRVCATNAAGNSAYSNIAQARTGRADDGSDDGNARDNQGGDD